MGYNGLYLCAILKYLSTGSQSSVLLGQLIQMDTSMQVTWEHAVRVKPILGLNVDSVEWNETVNWSTEIGYWNTEMTTPRVGRVRVIRIRDAHACIRLRCASSSSDGSIFLLAFLKLWREFVRIEIVSSVTPNLLFLLCIFVFDIEKGRNSKKQLTRDIDRRLAKYSIN